MNTNSQPPQRIFVKRILKTVLIILCALFLLRVLLIDFMKVHHWGRSLNVDEIFVNDEVDTYLQAYKKDTGQYPTTAQGLQALVTQPDGVKGWHGPYLPDMLLDPWSHPYQYAYPSTHGQPAGKYDCWSMGQDGISGTPDDMGNWPGGNPYDK